MRLKGKLPIFNVKDTRSLDSTLNPIIAEGLKKFKEVIMSDNVAGYPAEFELENDDEAFQNWLDVIDKMIYAFDANEPEIPDNYLEMHISDEADENGNFPCEFEILDQEKYDNHKADDEEHHRKVQEGLDLFAKYYKSLWW